MTFIEIVGGLLVLAVLTALGFAVKIVREYQRVVLFRLGRSLASEVRGSCSSIRSPTGR